MVICTFDADFSLADARSNDHPILPESLFKKRVSDVGRVIRMVVIVVSIVSHFIIFAAKIRKKNDMCKFVPICWLIFIDF